MNVVQLSPPSVLLLLSSHSGPTIQPLHSTLCNIGGSRLCPFAGAGILCRRTPNAHSIRTSDSTWPCFLARLAYQAPLAFDIISVDFFCAETLSRILVGPVD
jgi:hypothetical protein